MRKAIWSLIRDRLTEGVVLPWWALLVRAVLFPLDFFYWRMSQAHGYQWQTDTWLIDGVKYSGEALRWLSKAEGEIYKITRTGDVVTLKRVSEN